MDNHNKKAADVITTENFKKAIEHMYMDEETCKSLTYAEMRSRYG